MTDFELDSDGKIFTSQPTRMTRIARGSGTSVREIEDLLTQHRLMAGMAKNMSKMKKQGALGQNKAQMAAMQKRMQSGAMPPGPGGMDLGSMMKALGGGGGGMPNMAQMMQQFGGMMGGMGGGGGGRGGRR